MERIWMKNWPKGVSTTLQYRLGENRRILRVCSGEF
jgi:hypothetical protein